VLGGLAVGVTRFVINATDPLTLGAFRFGIGCLLLLPFALLQLDRWPVRRDLLGVAMLGLLYFGLYPILFNASLAFTTAVRGALALSTTPILTMLAAAVLGIESLTARKTFGVLIATLGVAVALLTGFATAPVDAWRGDLLMIVAALCQALYSIWSRPFIVRSGTIPYTFVGMTVGAAMLIAVSWSRGGFDVVNDFGPKQWAAIAFLGLFGGALGVLSLDLCAGTDDADTRGNYDYAQPAYRGCLWRVRLGRADHMEPHCRFAFGACGDLARGVPRGGLGR